MKFMKMCIVDVIGLGLALTLSGCDDPDQGASAAENEAVWIVPGDRTIPAENERSFTMADTAVVAAIDTELPGKIEFLDESKFSGPEAGVGMVAIGREGARALELAAQEDASALEVYLALGPASGQPPQALIDDHARLAAHGRVPAAPRSFLRFRETAETAMCVNSGDLTTYFASWSSGYEITFNDVATVSSANLYVVTGSSTKRALIGCVTYMEYAQSNLQVYNSANGTWSIFYDTNIGNGNGLAYRSSFLTNGTYRQRLWTGAGAVTMKVGASY